jgi:hypothetical protein
MTSSDHPTPAAAAAALDELAAARRAVSAAERRTLPLVLGATSFLTLVRYAARDHVPDRRVRRFVAGTCVALEVLLQLGNVRSTAVRPLDAHPDEHPDPRGASRLLLTSVGWLAAQRLAVAALRRSRLPWPHTAAGLLLAISYPLATLQVDRLLARPGHDG